MILILLALIVVFIISYVYLSDNRAQEFWSKHGIPYYKGQLSLGFAWEFFVGDKPMFQILDKIYQKYPDAPAIATKSFHNSALIVKHPENIQHVVAGDFNAFHHRGLDINQGVDLLADNILFMNGIRWKLTRKKFTPLFTSAKLRNMYYIMDKSAKDFVDYLQTVEQKESTLNVLSTFCSAAITASVFGINTKSIMESPLLEMAKKSGLPSASTNFKFALANASNKLFNLLKLRIFGQFEDFFIGTMKQVLQMRRTDKVKKHDFADLCLEVQKNGTLKDSETGYEIEPTDELMSAQAFFFFIAGVEPSALSMFHTLFELGRNPEILKRVHEEIDNIFDSNDNAISYEDIINLDYLDRCIDEAMRLHPPIASITRKCVQDAILPVGNIPVAKNVVIQLPVYSIHHDAKYYPDPERYDPDRFTEEAKKERPNYTFMPFGEGNRMCLGIRFAHLQIKTGLVHTLRHFTVKTDVFADAEIKYNKSAFQMRSDTIDFKFVPRLTQ